MARDQEKYNTYHRRYQLERYHRRRKKALELLGEECVRCGAQDDLQIDHKNPKKKSFSIARMWGVSEERFWKEVGKCQVLCASCHSTKTTKDAGLRPARGTHGTLSSYRYCRCKKCKAAKTEYNKVYRLKRRAQKSANAGS